jgi:tripeptide aminopeptidase
VARSLQIAPNWGLQFSYKKAEPVCKLAAKAAEKAGFPVQFKFSGGLSDANFLCGYNLPTVNLGCGMDKIHTTEEQLAEKDLVNTAAWVVSIITTATEK